MTDLALLKREQEPPDGSEQAAAPGRPLRRAALLALLAGTLIPMVAAGCGQSMVIPVDEGNFKSVVLDSEQPVLVDFYKDWCPLCLPVDAIMDHLSREYDGRAKVARFMIMTSYWTLPAVDIRDRYNINFVPIVVLFDKGVEVKRWVLMYLPFVYQGELNRLVPPPGQGSGQGLDSAKPREGLSPPPAALPPTAARPPSIVHPSGKE